MELRSFGSNTETQPNALLSTPAQERARLNFGGEHSDRKSERKIEGEKCAFSWQLPLSLLLFAALACQPADEEVSQAHWEPGQARTATGGAQARGFIDLRGLIHAHSVYSHDACDGEPRHEDGSINQPCLNDFRQAACDALHDFVMLSDHGTYFADTEFPDVLLFDASKGDRLIERSSRPAANWLSCGEQSLLIMAGSESGSRSMLPVGIEGHASTDIEIRRALYGSEDEADIFFLKENNGAVVLTAHTEDWSAEELSTLPVDGLEIYNLHANLMSRLDKGLELLAAVLEEKHEGLPHPDLSLYPLFEEDPRYLDTWAAVLASGARRVGTLGSDCHQNALPFELADNDRVDSYRRVVKWFSNHLLIKRTDQDGASKSEKAKSADTSATDTSGADTSGSNTADASWDDLDLKQALRAGRLYGSFDFLGYPEGFDFFARSGKKTYEMGDELSPGGTLILKAPKVAGLSPSAKAPELETRILRATESGWEEVAKGSGDLEFKPKKAGAYRAEVRQRAQHLRGFLGENAEALLKETLPWVLANPIYVGE